MTVIVGQQINLTCALKDANGNDLTSSLSNFQWTVPGYAISNYVPTVSSGIVYTNFPTNNTTVAFYWADGATNGVMHLVQVPAIFNGQKVSGQATFDVLVPQIALGAGVMGQIRIDTGNIYQDAEKAMYLK